VTVAIVAANGFIADELECMRTVFCAWPAARVVLVSQRVGPINGVGGTVTAAATFADVVHADVIVVPGGIGICNVHDHPQLRVWLRRTAPEARWILGSSTGSALLVAAGLVPSGEVSSHWLAGDLLGRYGGTVAAEALRVDGRVITASGPYSATRGALHVVAAEAGPEVAESVALESRSGGGNAPRPHRRWRRRRPAQVGTHGRR
jgi:transcriptional regulator GlxA family with amidase domain